MPARSRARKRAVDVLYEADQRGADLVAMLAERLAQADPPVPQYAADLVEGIAAHCRRIDEILAPVLVGWSMQRLAPVDRAILRLGVYELLWCDDVPDGVAIDEAVSLARALSTDESPRFVNGVLAQVQRQKPVPTS